MKSSCYICLQCCRRGVALLPVVNTAIEVKVSGLKRLRWHLEVMAKRHSSCSASSMPNIV